MNNKLEILGVTRKITKSVKQIQFSENLNYAMRKDITLYIMYHKNSYLNLNQSITKDGLEFYWTDTFLWHNGQIYQILNQISLIFLCTL